MHLLLIANALMIPTVSLQNVNKTLDNDPFPFEPGFDIQKVVALAESLPSHSWEYGMAAEALLELYNASLTVFGEAPLPVPTVSHTEVKGLKYAKSKITLNQGQGRIKVNALADGEGSTGDAASLGVSALMLGKLEPDYMQAATDTVDYLLGSAPRFWNEAISQRTSEAELW